MRRRFTTYEVIETTPLIVIKKDKSREEFDSGKVLGGMVRACEKRRCRSTCSRRRCGTSR